MVLRHQYRYSVLGFTIIELVMIIIVFSIISVTVLPRFAGKSFDERGFHDAVKSVLQHARHVAVASRRFVCVDINTTMGVVSLTRDTGLPDGKVSISCNSNVALASPSAGCTDTNQVCAPKDVAIGGTTSLVFDPIGRVVSAPGVVTTAATITITNQPDITVVAETGYVE